MASDTTPPGTDREQHLRDADLVMRRRVGKVFYPTLVFSGLFMFVMIAAMLVMAFGPGDQAGSASDDGMRDILRVATQIRVLQVVSGLVIGFVCVCLGFVMCWYGITGPMAIGASTPGGKMKVEATHIGITLLIGGLLLIGLALTRDVAVRSEAQLVPVADGIKPLEP